MITNVKEILTKAKDGGYAVGAFNTVNLETTQAIIQAAKELKSPVIIQVTEKTMEYAGGRGIFQLITDQAEFYAPEIPIGIHLDHGRSFEIIERAIEIGFTSVMYDGSRREYVDNNAMTKKIVDYCHERGVSIQAELGNVPYVGEGAEITEVDWDKFMTNPAQAAEFVYATKVDSLAVAIGNAHGFVKEKLVPDYERLSSIQGNVSIPLILHGASDWDDGRVAEAVKRGITCFNVDTAIRMAFTNKIIQAVKNDELASLDIRKFLGGAREAVKESVKNKLKLFGSEGKA
jgi:fructose-bisphosphate aldolase class II